MDAMSEDMTMLTDDELAERAASIEAERARRATLTDAERRVEEMCLAQLHAEGRLNGGPWQAPTGLLGAYPRGWRVTHDGGVFEAAVPGVTTAPPSSDWVEVDPDEPLTPFWQPGEHEAGARVRDAGQIWTAITTVDGPRPSEYPGGWTLA